MWGRTREGMGYLVLERYVTCRYFWFDSTGFRRKASKPAARAYSRGSQVYVGARAIQPVRTFVFRNVHMSIINPEFSHEVTV